MIETTVERIRCDCGNDSASKFMPYISKSRVFENGKHKDVVRQYIRCTVCSDMISQEEMNRQLEEPLVIDLNKRIEEGKRLNKLTK